MPLKRSKPHQRLIDRLATLIARYEGNIAVVEQRRPSLEKLAGGPDSPARRAATVMLLGDEKEAALWRGAADELRHAINPSARRR